MNSINLIGRIGKDVEMKYFDSGKVKAIFSLAVDRGRKDKDGVKLTDWFACEVWSKTAEFAGEYVKKGDRVAVTGSMFNDRYEKDGQKRDFWKVQGERLDLLSSKSEASGDSGSAGEAEIPF